MTIASSGSQYAKEGKIVAPGPSTRSMRSTRAKIAAMLSPAMPPSTTLIGEARKDHAAGAAHIGRKVDLDPWQSGDLGKAERAVRRGQDHVAHRLLIFEPNLTFDDIGIGAPGELGGNGR
jgi:hypothetical protein